MVYCLINKKQDKKKSQINCLNDNFICHFFLDKINLNSVLFYKSIGKGKKPRGNPLEERNM